MPVPTWLRLPVPETAPLRLKASDRLKTSAPLLVTLPTMAPAVPPTPTCRLPAATVVPPL